MTEEEYEIALARIEALMNISEDEMSKEECSEFDRMATAIDEYEDIHHPIDPPEDPQER